MLKDPNPAVARYLKSYQSNFGIGKVVSFIGGFAMGWLIGGAIAGRKFDTGFFFAGVGLTGIGVGVFGISAIKSLKKAVLNHNKGINEKKISFSPLFYQDKYLQTNAGFVISF